MTDIDIDALQAWVGKQQSQQDVASLSAVAGLSATLDYFEPCAQIGDELPAPWHWLYFLPTAPASAIDHDGHPRRGGFLPPVPLPRRMWASSSLEFKAPIHVGNSIRKLSTIDDVSLKNGSSGQLVFVSVLHETFSNDTLAISEQQQLVYRAAATADDPIPAAKPAPAEAQWQRVINPDPVMLFRYSALTFNSHRIHYDRDYAMNQEHYAGLVVQGPLTATLLLDLLRREMPKAVIKSFSFRGVSPLLDTDTIHLQGRCDGQQVQLWALNGNGGLAMTAKATLA